MEVDFLAADLRFAIELVGAQHLADADAYRRDRRKDTLLQQHGYLVLRFLAEDAGKHLDGVPPRDFGAPSSLRAPRGPTSIPRLSNVERKSPGLVLP